MEKNTGKKEQLIQKRGNYTIRENHLLFIPAVSLIAASVLYAIELKEDIKDGISTGETVCSFLCVLSLLGGIYLFIKAVRKRLIVGANHKYFRYVPAIGRAREIRSAEVAKIEMDLSGSRMDLIDKSGDLFARLTDDMPEIDRLYEEVKNTEILKYEEDSEKNWLKIYRGKTLFISFAITTACISVASIFMSASLYHAVYCVVPFFGIILFFFFGRYFSPGDEDDLDWPSMSLWISAAAILTGIVQSTLILNRYGIAFLMVLFSLIYVLVIKSRFYLRKADKLFDEIIVILGLSIIVMAIAIAMGSGISYTFAKADTVYATVADKYGPDDDDWSDGGYYLVINNKDANLEYESVMVYSDTYESTEVGDVIPVELRQSIFNITNIQASEREKAKLFSEGILGSDILANLVILGIALAIGIIQSVMSAAGIDMVFILGIISIGLFASCVYYFIERESIWIIMGLGIFGLVTAWVTVYLFRLQVQGEDEEDEEYEGTE